MAPAGEWSADAEVGTTAVVDPEAALVDTPGAAANAGRAADLANELDIAAVADVTPVPFPVVGRARDPPSIAGLRVRGCRDSEGGADNGDGDQEKLPCACHLTSFRDEDCRWYRARWKTIDCLRDENIEMRIFCWALLVEEI